MTYNKAVTTVTHAFLQCFYCYIYRYKPLHYCYTSERNGEDYENNHKSYKDNIFNFLCNDVCFRYYSIFYKSERIKNSRNGFIDFLWFHNAFNYKTLEEVK